MARTGTVGYLASVAAKWQEFRLGFSVAHVITSHRRKLDVADHNGHGAMLSKRGYSSGLET